MGAGKQDKAGGGDGDGLGKEAAEPVVLRMELHCAGCAKKVRKSIHHMPGVVSVVADPAANTVVVAGTADAAALKARIEAKTKKPIQILSAGGAAEPKKRNPGKQHAAGGGEEKRNPDKGDKAGASQTQPSKEEESKGKKQPPEETKNIEETPTTALLRIRLHCDSCADRIRRRIYKIKGVKDVVLEGNGAKDEVKVVGTMDVPAMVAYLNDKLNRAVELAPPTAAPGGNKDSTKAKAGDDGHVKKDKGADAHKADKGKGIEVAGPSVASAAAFMAAPAGASTHHVSPYGYGVAYPQPPQGPPPGYYGGAGYGNAGGYYQHQPSSDAGGYFQHQPRGGGGYYDQPSAGGYYQQQPGGYGQHPHNPPAYPFDTAPAPQMFSDENPNSCSLM